jgi:hypothetical protein
MRYTLPSRFAVLAIVAILVVTSACSADPTAPTPNPISQALEVYSGPLDPGGTSTYLFTLNQKTTLQVMLAGVLVDGPLRSISPVLRLQIGAWDGSACVPRHEIDTAPRLTAALHAWLEPGTYCASLTDPGSLTEPVGATMRIVAPALVRTNGSGGTVTFTNTITPGGSASRSFEVSVAGTVTLTLNSFSTGAEAAIGIGVLSTDGRGCRLARIVRALPGGSPQISTQVDPGDFCATVFDVGNLTQNATFLMTIVHP